MPESERKIFIGMPVGSGQVMLNTVISLITSMVECHDFGWRFPKMYFRGGDSDLCRARNAVVTEFVKSDCTDLVMIDSDISWRAGDLTRLVAHKKEFVAACYRGKTDEKDLYFIQWPEKKELYTDPDTGFPLLKVDGTAIGFCRLTRACVEKLVESLNGHHYIDPLYPDDKIHWLIDFERRDGARLEEGYSLCRRWRELGGDVWIDPMLNLGHMGLKVFESNMIEFLERIRNIMLSQNLSSKRLEELLTEKLTPQFRVNIGEAAE